jgi:asparagine synthase (glutamine-hydrolysing)
MCGIGGLASVDPDATLPRAVCVTLQHRGPDASGFSRLQGDDWHIEFAHTRLAIVDLSQAGEQPMADESGDLVMIFNGEIYNSPELRNYCESRGHRFASTMDGEVILHLWEMEGAEALKRLNGIFAVALADRRTGDLYLARDPLGVKPLYYSSNAESLWFGSEVRAVVAAGAPAGNVDVQALGQFLSFLWIPDPRSVYKGIRSLEPGMVLRWRRGAVDRWPYCTPFWPTEDVLSMDAPTATTEARRRIKGAAQRQLMADVPVGLMASGGVDSGLIWWATHQTRARIYTISWQDNSQSTESLEDDCRAVAALEKRFGGAVSYLNGADADRDALPVTGDLFGDAAFHLTRFIARAARRDGLKVLLSGQGGDELFGGYRRHFAARLLERKRVGTALRWLGKGVPTGVGRHGYMTAEYVSRLKRALAERDPFDGYMQLCTYSSARERAEYLGCTEREMANAAMWQRHREVFESVPPKVSFLRKAMAVDLNVYLPGMGLAFVDRGAMEFSVEVRVPLLDLELVRWALQLPESLMLRRIRGKWITRSLAETELQPSVANRPKRAFAAPVEVFSEWNGRAGDQGFRQGMYFARATKILDRFLASPDVDISAPAR